MGSRSGSNTRTVNSTFDRRLGVQEQDTRSYANSLDVYEREISELPYERAQAFDANGNSIFEKSGESEYVPFTAEEYRSLTNATLTHNHPTKFLDEHGYDPSLPDNRADGGPFSKADIRTAVDANLQELRAVTEQYTYRLVRPVGGWPDGFSRAAQLGQNAAMKRAMRELERRFGNGEELYYRDGMGVVDRYLHTAMEQTTRRFNVSYIRTEK